MKKIFAVGLMFATMSISSFAATKDTKFWAGTKKVSKSVAVETKKVAKTVVEAPVKGVKRIFKVSK